MLTKEVVDSVEFAIQEHEIWLKSNRKQGKQADFSYRHLEGINLSGRELSYAIFNDTHLNGARFNQTNLRRASFIGADLERATFYDAILTACDFRSANLLNASIMGSAACDVDFSHANLNGANIGSTNFSCAHFSEASLYKTKGVPPIVCPTEGSFTAFKAIQVPMIEELNKWIIAELIIPAHARRSSACSRKCRADEAEVVRFWNLDHTPCDVSIGISSTDPYFAYIPGNTVRPTKPFNTDRWIECSTGIHFFVTFQEAVEYGK